jgi:hypothetical protein
MGFVSSFQRHERTITLARRPPSDSSQTRCHEVVIGQPLRLEDAYDSVEEKHGHADGSEHARV